MTARYKLQPGGVLDQETGAFIPGDVENSDWRAFLAFQEAGNEADPYKTDAELKAEQQATALAAIDEQLEADLAKGVEYPEGSGKYVQLRSQDLINITGAVVRATLAQQLGGWPIDFTWILADNTILPLPFLQDMIALGSVAFTKVTELRLAARAAKDAILR